MASPEQESLWAFKGMLTELPAAQQVLIQKAHDEIKALVLKHGESGGVALCWLAMELAAEQEKAKRRG